MRSTDTKNINNLTNFIRGYFTTFEILEEPLGLVLIQNTIIVKDILKAKVLCISIKFLKVKIFAYNFTIKFY